MVTPSEGPKAPAPVNVVIPVAPGYRFCTGFAKLCQVSHSGRNQPPPQGSPQTTGGWREHLAPVGKNL